ncbi:MAG: hypothetical protein HEQ38_13110 [Gemmatimonas sp.]|nr:hypothetical protein [Gemmatimonas sp.]
MRSAVGPSANVRPVNEPARLQWVGGLMVCVGMALVLLAVAMPDTLGALYQLYSTLPTDAALNDASRFGAGLFGALTVGWGVTLHQLGRGIAVSRAAVIGAVVWFIVDSAASIALGFQWNALSNVGFLSMFLVLLPWRRPR